MKAKLTVLTIAAAAALVVVAPTSAAEDMDGQKLFESTHKCSMCHSVPAAGIESKTKSAKMKGADLGGKVETPVAELAAFMRGEGEIDGKSHKKEFKGSDEELQAIIDWLGTLEAQE